MNGSESESTLGKIIGTAVLAIVCIVLGWIGHSLMPDKKAPAGVNPMAAVQFVAITNAVERPYNLPRRYVAWVEPMQEVVLVPEIEGYIKEICFKEGDVVKAGAELYRLDGERYQAQVNQRKADLYAAETELLRAERQFKRMLEADARGITQLERDNAEAAAATAKAAVEQAKANLVVAEYYLKRCSIVAPFTGKMGKSAVHIGDYVAPSKGSLAKLVQFDPIRVKFPVTDRELLEIRREREAGNASNHRLRLLLPDGTEFSGEGRLDFDDNEVSDSTATISMRAKFANPDSFLFPNLYVTLLADYREAPKMLQLPQQCFIDLTAGKIGVWVIGEDGVVAQRPVEALEADHGWRPVVAGLEKGEKIVLSGVGKLRAGMKVAEAVPTANDDLDENFKPTLPQK